MKSVISPLEHMKKMHFTAKVVVSFLFPSMSFMHNLKPLSSKPQTQIPSGITIRVQVNLFCKDTISNL